MLTEEPGNQLYQLYRLLAAIESGKTEMILPLANGELQEGATTSIGRVLLWYQALAWIGLGRTNEAEALLEQLIRTQGPYNREAGKLQKKMLK